MAITNKAIKARVRRGVEFLNERLGLEWRQHIELDDLDMSSGSYQVGGCGCILAQLDYSFFADEGEGNYDHMAEDVLE